MAFAMWKRSREGVTWAVPSGQPANTPDVLAGWREVTWSYWVQTWNSDTCPAGHPVFAVMVTRK